MALTKKQLVVRLKSVEGHLRGVQRMVEVDAYCIDLIQQAQAVRRALDKWNSLVLEGHLHERVTAALREESSDTREQAVTELLDIFQPNANAAPTPQGAGAGMATEQRLTLLRELEAQARAVQALVENDAASIELIRQTRAIQRGLDAFNRAVLADHLNGCVTQAIRGERADEREQMVNELLQLFTASSAL
jgi:DNA-binding FrmR family transcriptional regulator